MTEPSSRPGGPRRADAIFHATLTLLAERGYDGLTIEGVAARSGVNKTTIYRWWPTKDALLGAAVIDSSLLELNVPDTGSLRGDLLALTEHLIRLLTSEETAAVVAAALTAIPGRPHLAQLAHRFFADRLAKERPLLARAVARGELEPDTDVLLMLDLLAGAIWFRLLMRQAPVDDGYAERLVDAVLGAIGPRPGEGARSGSGIQPTAAPASTPVAEENSQ